MLKVVLDGARADASRSGERGQRLDVCAPPFGSRWLDGIAVRIDERAPKLLEPVGTDEALQVARAQVEPEPAAVLEIQVVAAGLRLGKEILGHDRGETRTRALAYLGRAHLQDVEQWKAAGAGRRPIHDANELAVLDEEVSGPEIAVRNAARESGQIVRQPLSQFAERLRMCREMSGADLGIPNGRRSRMRAVDPQREELGEKLEALSCDRAEVEGPRATQSPLDRPPRKPSGPARFQPRHTLRDSGLGIRAAQRRECSPLLLDPLGGRPERDPEQELRRMER